MIDAAIQAAKSAGEIIRTNFSESALPTVTYKDPNNVVTETDVAAEVAISSILKKEFPDYAFFSEEAGASTSTSENLWVIDPLDGTSNFAHHIPYFCVSIALFKDKQPILGVIYDPIHDELFSAEVGKGAFLNGEKITGSTTQEPSRAITTLGRGASEQAKDQHGKLYTTITSHVRTSRIIGSIALGITHTACGRFDASIVNASNFYDCAAANIIAREAGVLVSDFSGNPLTNETEGIHDILVTNTYLQPKIVKILHQV